MDLEAVHSSIAAVSRQLPFAIDDTDQVNEVFGRWCREASLEDERLIALWTYCFVRRYFMFKFVRRSYGGVADMDELIETTYQRISNGWKSIQDPTRYAQWVSVVCRNTFLNYVRDWQRVEVLAEEVPDGDGLHVHQPEYDRAFLFHVLHQAIARLPASLQEAVRLRLIQDCEYDEISRITGKSPAVVRSYVYKALQRLRDDPQLVGLLQSMEEHG